VLTQDVIIFIKKSIKPKSIIGIQNHTPKKNKGQSFKVENIFKGNLDSIPSPSVKIQTIGRKVCLRCKSKTLLGVVNKLLKTKSLLTSYSNVLPHYLK